MSSNLTAPDLRLAFLDYLFEEREGFLCIATIAAKSGKKKDFKQQFFAWPEQRELAGAYIEQNYAKNNIYFCPNLFRRPERKRDYALPTKLVWADLDYCDPSVVTPAPQCRIESSPKKFQALWRLDQVVDPDTAQNYSKRIAYAYSEEGADKSGWDIEQLLRVPWTHNFKYDNGVTPVPEVTLMTSFEALLPVAVFEQVTQPTPEEDIEAKEPLPDVMSLPAVANVLYAKRNELRNTGFQEVFTTEPASDWSAAMWRLINICLEVGMEKEEVFAVCLEAKCNKYDRDNRPISYLWKEITKAEYQQKQITLVFDEAKPLKMPIIYNSSEVPHSIITDYKDWAVEATDAVEEYHEIACTILLSSILSGGLFLNASFGKVVPNLWGLILGDSTLTRKTTAMKMAMEFVGEIDREIVVATDGSVEGMLTALATRPGLVSVFYKDEISGFIDSINRKDYLAGMPETLTQLYDVPEFFTRRLRKETVTVTNPVFIFFGGGIRDKMYSLLNDEFILSGFLPRFLIVGGDADLSKIRPTGPLAPQLGDKRRLLRERFVQMHTLYNETMIMEVPGMDDIIRVPTQKEVILTDDAWKFFQDTELQLAVEASESPSSLIAQPTFGRLAWSMLKMGMLFAAARQEPIDDKITTTLEDLRAAAYYIQRWGVHTIDLIQNVGRSANQRVVSRVYQYVRKRPGCLRSELSRFYHLDKRELDMILNTLLDRGQIRLEKVRNGFAVYPL